MPVFRKVALLACSCAVLVCSAQKLKKEDYHLIEKLQQHVQYLAADSLEGRRTGTKGEKLAAAYIASQFANLGLQPKGTAGYFQNFTISEGRQVKAATAMTLNNTPLTPVTDFFPMAYSGNGTVNAMPAIALQERNMPWFFNLETELPEHAANPHFDVEDLVYNKAKDVQQKGAAALIVYNSSTTSDGLKFNPRNKFDVLKIPVVYVSAKRAAQFFSDPTASVEIELTTDVAEKTRTGTNVIGFIDNGAANTVVLGAHYDHLGFGEDGNSLAVLQTPAVHNGADDNASGTAALIELARLIKPSRLDQNNYAFIAFSGEELGLFGSKYFTTHPTIDLQAVNYMINMDMVGRLNDASPIVTLGGFGTSPFWATAFKPSKKSKLYTANLQFHIDSSGVGPSDHTSFYLKNIPVLFYFTGTHADYHKPSDDFEKLNLKGELLLIKHIYSLVQLANNQKEKLLFTKTKDLQAATTASFSVTLGIIPDYTFTGAGVKVDAVSDGRVAQKAGINAGDVITALGAYKISSMETYMQALGKFKKGDATQVSFNRNGEQFTVAIVF